MASPVSNLSRRLFLLDGAGALVSAFFLGVVLPYYQDVFGIPRQALFVLAGIPCVFAVYDLACFLFAKRKPGKFLQGIAIANGFYCILSLGLAGLHYREMTFWGWGYILAEVVIVLMLAQFEFRVGRKSSQIDS